MVLDNLYKIGIVVLATGTIAGAVGWFLRESPREMPPVLRELSEGVATEFAEKLPRNRDINDLLLLILQRGNRDEEREFRDLLKKRVRNVGKYRIQDWEEIAKKFDNTISTRFFKEMGFLPTESPRDLAQAKKALKLLSKTGQVIEGVLIVNVTDFDEGQEGFGASVACEGEIYNVDKESTVATVPAIVRKVDSHFNYTYLHHRIARMNFVGRFFAWFLVAATLPFAMIGVVRAVVRKRKNELNVAMLAAFTLLDLVLGWILISEIGYGLGTGIFMLILAGLMGYYNYDACDYIERRLA